MVNEELARILTVALVNYIDNNRPDGTMCCSNMECEKIEKAFINDRLDIVDGFIQNKLKQLTEFEEKLVSFALQCNGEDDVAIKEVQKWSPELLEKALDYFKKTDSYNGEIVKDLTNNLRATTIDYVDGNTFNFGEKVKIIVLKNK